ncbi:MAG: hypothetical protein GXZ10_02490 [Gammaproteobacteria bacterium]|nr:hypothetical protein [Gammaproteobacteria bacterium]
MSQRYAPGVRVEIRDAEWRIKCIDHTSDGGELLTCEGLSELVRGREATFLTKIEPNIRILAPEDTLLIDVGLPRTARKADLDNGISYAIALADTQPVVQASARQDGIIADLQNQQSHHNNPEPAQAHHAHDSNNPYRTEQNIALGWNDIQHLKAGDIVSKTYTDITQATDPIERTIVYEAPFFKPNREEDYALAWGAKITLITKRAYKWNKNIFSC